MIENKDYSDSFCDERNFCKYLRTFVKAMILHAKDACSSCQLTQ